MGLRFVPVRCRVTMSVRMVTGGTCLSSSRVGTTSEYDDSNNAEVTTGELGDAVAESRQGELPAIQESELV